jgi:FAD/FMN-containing dehydrogenase
MTSAATLSWGRYPRYPQQTHPVFWQDDIAERLASLKHQFGYTLPFGAGRSYGDSCLSGSDQVLLLTELDRFIQIDWSSGILRAEAGVTIQQILELSVPRGWFLPVTPGTRFVTLGGAIANDVHGKNHHRSGTFGCFVRRLALLRSDGATRQLSATENVDLFKATIGGLGLTGIICWAEIQLQRINSSELQVSTQRYEQLADFFALSDIAEAKHDFCVAWVDCAAPASQLGRGVFYAADFAHAGPLQAEAIANLKMPLTPPVSMVGRWSLKLFNELYWRKAPSTAVYNRQSYASFFYPLDGIQCWNRIYGAAGFQQYQAVLPANDAEDAIASMLRTIAAAGAGSTLAVLKRCGQLQSPGLLSFPMPGTTLALDFPQNDGTAALFANLDAIVREAGGRLYPAKDAHMIAADFQRSYPAWIELEKLRDPALMSRFWKRVTQ